MERLSPVFFIAISSLLVIFSCANPQPPSGGPVDNSAPVIDTANSTAIIQRNFPITGSERSIEMHFNEYVELKNPTTEIVISPPLSSFPEVKARKKTVTLTMPDDTLKPNTTYIVNFGSAIVDFTEGNPLENLQYVFSTGEVIDSLDYSVKVLNTKGSAAEGVTVMLYDSPSDSVIYNDLPNYFAKTNSSGIAEFNYLKNGNYQLIALKDENRPYIYDSETEEVGFLDTLINPSDSSKMPTIQLFTEKSLTYILDSEEGDKGKSFIVFNHTPDELEYSFSDSGSIKSHYLVNDSLIIWTAPKVQGKEISLYVTYDDGRTDTADLNVSPFEKVNLPTLKLLKPIPEILKLRKSRDLSLYFSRPLTGVNSEYIVFRDTSGKALNFKAKLSTEKNDPRSQLAISLRSGAQSSGEFMFLPGAVTDIFGETHDTIRLEAEPIPSNTLSDMYLKIKDLNRSENYIFTLKKNDKTYLNRYIVGKDSLLIEVPAMIPDNYVVSLVTDKNKNSEYDGASIRQRRYAEPRRSETTGSMKENWDFEMIITPYDK